MALDPAQEDAVRCAWRLVPLVFALAGCRREPSSAPVRVAAAADLARAFEQLEGALGREAGAPVVFSFGASALLAKQLHEGAPFDLFTAANVAFVDEAVAAGACDGASKRVWARGRLALWSKGGVTSLAALSGDDVRRVAIANPAHAPYGLAAKQALSAAKVWDAVEDRLVLAENVRQALQFAETGNADAALVALALVSDGRAPAPVVVDEALHAPLDQALAVCTRGANRAGAEAVARFLVSPEGQAAMRRFGFTTPPAGDGR